MDWFDLIIFLFLHTSMSTATVNWEPFALLSGQPNEPFSLIIVNQQIRIKQDVMVSLWNAATLRVTVDGGTDRWLEWMKKNTSSETKHPLPDLVTGDFDSVKKDTLADLTLKGVTIIETPDQDKTDLCKAIECVCQHEKHSVENWIVVVSEVGGRFDHILSQLNTLHMHDTRIMLISSNNAMWLLRPGKHSISVAPLLKSDVLSEDRSLGLIPIGKPAIVSSTGLKWNLDNTEMKFGGLVSSSNTFNGEPTITVVTNESLLWIMSIAYEDKLPL